MIDSEEYEYEAAAEVIELDASGKPTKFKKDKFYGKSLPELTDQEIEYWLNWFEQSMPKQFKRNKTDYDIPVVGKPEPRPLEFNDPANFTQLLVDAEAADIRMQEAEKLAKLRRKERLKEFHRCIREYLDSFEFTNN